MEVELHTAYAPPAEGHDSAAAANDSFGIGHKKMWLLGKKCMFVQIKLLRAFYGPLRARQAASMSTILVINSPLTTPRQTTTVYKNSAL